MRISELSDRSGIAVASIKFYAREGLLPAGERVGYNQTDYDETHLERLRLIHALTSVGGLSIAAAGEVLRAVDDPQTPVLETMAVAHHAIPGADATPSAASIERVHRLIAERGWCIELSTNPGIPAAAAVLDEYASIGRPELAATLDGYAEAAERIAEADLDTLADASIERIAETVVVGTVLGDVLLAAVRRLAQEDLSARRFGGVATTTTTTTTGPAADHPSTTDRTAEESR